MIEEMQDYQKLKKNCNANIVEYHAPELRNESAEGKARNVSKGLKTIIPVIFDYEFKQDYIILHRDELPREALMIHEICHVYDKIGAIHCYSMRRGFKGYHKQFIKEHVNTYDRYDSLKNPDYLHYRHELFARLLNLWLIHIKFIRNNNYLLDSPMDFLCYNYYKDNRLEIDKYFEKTFPKFKELTDENKIQEVKSTQEQIIR